VSGKEQARVIERFLAREYRPAGYRAQLMVGFPALPHFETAATDAVESAGLEPGRRVARMHPRPSEDAIRTGDLVEFIVKYGHEYCAGLLGAERDRDIMPLTAAAHASGFRILWDLSMLDSVVPDDLERWGVDAAVSSRHDFATFLAI
jgi:kynureninase